MTQASGVVVKVGTTAEYTDMYGYETSGTVVASGPGWCRIKGKLGATEQKRPEDLIVWRAA